MTDIAPDVVLPLNSVCACSIAVFPGLASKKRYAAEVVSGYIKAVAPGGDAKFEAVAVPELPDGGLKISSRYAHWQVPVIAIPCY